MNLMGGLQALGNFGTGMIQGQQNAINNNNTNQMNALALDDAQMKNQQTKTLLQQQQALSDKAMSLFSPAKSNPPDPSSTPTQGGDQGGNGQQQQGDQNIPQQTDTGDTSDKLMKLSQAAFGSGNLVQGNELMTNAINLKTAQFDQAQKQSAIQTAALKRQQLSRSFVAQTLGAAQNKDQFDQAKMEVLSSPYITPEEAKNIAGMQYSPQFVDHIRQAGMTGAQQATAQLNQMKLDETKRKNAFDDSIKAQRLAGQQQSQQFREQHMAQQTKVGAAAHAPSTSDLTTATPIVKEAFGNDVDVKSPEFEQAVSNISSRALQITQSNRAVTYPQAVAQATQEAKGNGELQTQTTADTRTKVMGVPIPGTGSAGGSKTTYASKGATQQDAIPYTGAQQELVPGKWYNTSHGVLQWDGKVFRAAQ